MSQSPFESLNVRKNNMESIIIKGIKKPVSRLGLGCWQLGGHGWGINEPTKTTQAVLKALERGITFFDTAPIYGLGESERVLGKLIKDQRDKVVVASKVGLKWETNKGFIKKNDLSPDRIRVEVKESIKRLDTDYIDLYQIHWPDLNTPLESTMNTLNCIKDEGLIKAIGVCNFSLKQLIEATQYSEIASIQIPYSLIDRTYENIFDYCIKKKISIICYSPLAKGLLAGRFSKIVSFPSNDHRKYHPYFSPREFKNNLEIAQKVSKVAREVSMTPSQCALLWVLNQPAITVAIFGATTSRQVEENTMMDYTKISKTTLDTIIRELS
jgi:aryl-alcohol dehydrogenase-like predicted oxidoreductase